MSFGPWERRIRSFFSHLLPALLLLTSPAPLRSQLVKDGATNTLNNTATNITGDLIVGTNGSFTLLVIQNSSVVSNTANGVIGLNASAKSNELQVINEARWAPRDIYLGSNGSFNRLTLDGRARVTNVTATLGANTSASNNVASVTDAVWSNAKEFSLGVNGAGNQLRMGTMGVVLTFASTIGANITSSNNLAVVSGSGSMWINANAFSLGFNGASNQLWLTNQGALLADSSTIGVNSTSSNNLAVVSGSGSIWSNASTLQLSGGGWNQLIVTNGGFVRNTIGSIANTSSSVSNLVLVTGAGSVWSNSAELYVGNSGPGNQLLVRANGKVLSRSGYVGANSTASGNFALVTEAGSLWSNSFDLNIGSFSSGNQLAVSNQGKVTVGGHAFIGSTFGNGNSVVVSDVNSRWLINSNLYLGSNGSFNSLAVGPFAVVSNNNGIIGFGAASVSNLAVVAGPGAWWTNRTELHVGESGSGSQVVVSNSGVVFAGGQSIVGKNAGANSNAVTLTGGSSTWQAYGGFNLGVSGAFNRLVLTNGGTLRVSGDVGRIGLGANSNSAIVTGAGSIWSNQFDLLVGDGSRGNSLVVTNGGSAISSNGLIGAGIFGYSNLAVVTGAGSLWTNTGTVTVGARGSSNQLTVAGGAKVVGAIGLIGSDAGRNFALLSDTGTKWLLSSNLCVGSNGGFNTLMISNGAVVQNGFGFIGTGVSSSSNVVTVTGSGSTWSNKQDLFVGLFGSSNRLLVSNGGVVRSANATLRGTAGPNNDNQLIVTGTGSVFSADIELDVGFVGAGNRMVVSNGATLKTGFADIGVATSSNNEMVVTGPGTTWTNSSDLYVGGVSTGNRLIISNSAEILEQTFNVIVGLAATATNNRMIVDGGTLRVPNVGSVLEVRGGTNVLNAGLIDVNGLLLTNTLGAFELNGGTLRTAGTTHQNGRTFTAGNGTSSANLQLQGGTHTFSNNGTIIGAVTALPGSTLAPGTSVGKLIFSNSPVMQGATIMEISRSGSTITNDQVQVATPLTYGGSLVVTNIGPDPPAAGNRFPLFSATSFNGSFSNIGLPALSPGFSWANKLLLDGSVEVMPSAPSLTIQSSNNIVSVSWPTNASSYCLQTTFDVTPPAVWHAVSAGISTNSSSFVFTFTSNPSTPKQFFRLAFPCSAAPTPVALSIQVSNKIITLSWPSTVFRLETAFNLAPPISWQTLSNGITQNGSLSALTFTNNPGIPNQVFRLSFP
jgi:T5SS/PEP-CTERM-associated repeat protein